MPLSEEEQRILSEIERRFYASDPKTAHQLSTTTLYRHAGRNLKWAALGFLAGFAVLVGSFATSPSLFLGFLGFAVMLACAFVFERNLRKMGKAGWKQVAGSLKTTQVKEQMGDVGKRLKKRFRREE